MPEARPERPSGQGIGHQQRRRSLLAAAIGQRGAVHPRTVWPRQSVESVWLASGSSGNALGHEESGGGSGAETGRAASEPMETQAHL